MIPAVTLRDVIDSDLPVFFEMQRDPESVRMAAFPARDHEAFTAHWARLRGDATLIVKTILSGDRVAGYIGTWPNDSRNLVGYWIDRPLWGQGIATAALRQFLPMIPARPLTAFVATHNAASLRVLQKAGFSIVNRPTGGGSPDDSCDEWELIFT
jgi:RimJ/RimL family protein N-acetyltransferase